jgi:sec-independent protein translocase protein TatC
MNHRIPSDDLFEHSRMSFGEHLEELRGVLIRCLISAAIGCVFGFMFANPIVKMLTRPLVKAMEEYIKTESIENLVNRKGYVDPDLDAWLQEEKFVPRQTYVDPLDLVAAIQTILPNFADQIKIEPYGFRPENFQLDKINELCQLISQPTPPPAKPPAAGEKQGAAVTVNAPQPTVSPNSAIPLTITDRTAQQKKLGSLLTDAEQATLRQIAIAQPADTDSKEKNLAELTNIFNRIIRETKLFEEAEFATLVQPPETGWLEYWIPPPTNPLIKMKQQFDQSGDPSIAGRLNRAMLANLFSDYMRELRADLVPLDVWERADFQPQALGVTETFMVWLKAGILSGITLAGPFIFYHLWSFVAAGLYPHEQKYVYIYLPISIALFVSGVVLVFLFVFEPVLQFLFSFNRQMGIAPQMRINDWLSFVMFMPVGFGVAFQLPLVMLFMNRIGIFQVSDYLQKWRVAVMSIFVLSMFLTPQDPISLLLLAIPLCFLYFLGVGMCIWMPRHQNPFDEPERQYSGVVD